MMSTCKALNGHALIDHGYAPLVFPGCTCVMRTENAFHARLQALQTGIFKKMKHLCTA